MTIALPEIEISIGNVLRLGDDIELVILHAPGKAVRIGVKAPACVVVMRKEIAHVDAVAARSEPVDGGRR